MSAVCNIIKSEKFMQRYNIKVYFLPQYEFRQNTRMQIEIKQAIVKHKQLLANIRIFKAQGISWVNSQVSDIIKESLRDIELKIECKSQPGQKLFIALEKNKNGSYTLFYRKKFHKEVSIVVDHLPAYFLKLHEEGVLSLFDSYY